MKNISQIQVGHLPRQVASKLASLLDRRAVTVEGVINDGNRKSFLCCDYGSNNLDVTVSGAGYSLSM